MKPIICLAVAALLSSFTNRPTNNDDMNGIWMGFYRSEFIREKVVVKFDLSAKMEFYTGAVDERTRVEGSYRTQGDSVFFSYKTPEGEVISMKGRYNRRMNYVEGSWKGDDRSSGRFYIERQQAQECFI